MLLFLGVGMSLNGAACEATIWMCILLYSAAKVVSSQHHQSARRSPRRRLTPLLSSSRLVPPPVHSVGSQCITFFLVERCHIVHGQHTSRFKNRIYLSNCLLLVGWLAILLFLIVSHKTSIRPSDGQCRFYISRWSSLAAGLLDIVIILYLSLLFALPLYRGR